MGSVSIIGIVIFIGLAKAKEKYDLGIYTTALMSVITPFAIQLLLAWINASLVKETAFSAFAPSTFIILILQYIVALMIFNRLDYSESATAAWLWWLASGSVIIFLIIPYLALLF
jgi:hypothetical protein